MRTLVIADDDDGVRQTLKSLVDLVYSGERARGELHVLTAQDGVEATEVCGSSEPDLIIMDVNMPRMDGIEAFYRIVDARGGRAPNTIFLTGYAGSGTVRNRMEKAIADGALGYLVKPAPLADLKRIIDEHVFADARAH